MALQALDKAIYVPVGEDRHKESGLMIWGMIPIAIKVSTADSGGGLLVFQHENMGKGGPPRHIHHAQDEWFYVVKGEFLFEINGEIFHPQAGDSLFAPRRIPHVFANVGAEPATLLVAMSPAGTFENFIREAAQQATLPAPAELEKAFESGGMTIVGPPLRVALH